jgi:MFS family permease
LSYLESDFSEVVLYEFFKKFAFGMLGIFIPLLIFDATGNLYYSLLFIGVSAGSKILVSVPIARLIGSTGFKTGLYLSYAFLVPSVLIARYYSYSFAVVVLVGFLYSAGKVFHKQGLELEFASDTSESSRDMKAAELMSIPSVGGFLGPVVGGLVISAFGFEEVLIVALSSILVSVVPLTLVESKHGRNPLNKGFSLDSELLRYYSVFFVRGFQGASAVSIFALFVYLFVGGSLEAGGARSLDTLGFILAALVSGRLASRYGRTKILVFGSLFSSVTYVLRGFVFTSTSVFALSLFAGIAFKIFHIPLISSIADEADKRGKLGVYAVKNIFSGLGGSAAAVILFVFVAVFNKLLGFRAVFAAAGVLTLVLTVFSRNLE